MKEREKPQTDCRNLAENDTNILHLYRNLQHRQRMMCLKIFDESLGKGVSRGTVTKLLIHNTNIGKIRSQPQSGAVKLSSLEKLI